MFWGWIQGFPKIGVAFVRSEKGLEHVGAHIGVLHFQKLDNGAANVPALLCNQALRKIS